MLKQSYGHTAAGLRCLANTQKSKPTKLKEHINTPVIMPSDNDDELVKTISLFLTTALSIIVAGAIYLIYMHA